GHHQEDRAGAGQDGADQAQIHPAPREKEGGLTVKLFKGHYTSSVVKILFIFEYITIPPSCSSEERLDAFGRRSVAVAAVI
ncbi:MAG: hypothetical protein ACREYE_19460, partial [Gammaproteobacteria bacterium]